MVRSCLRRGLSKKVQQVEEMEIKEPGIKADKNVVDSAEEGAEVEQ